MQNINDVIQDYSGNSRKVLDYSQIMKRMVDTAKEPGFSAATWAPLAELKAMIDTDKFERVGNFKEVMNWDSYVDFLANWAPNAEWECSFKRITERSNVVFLELEERTSAGGYNTAVNSLSVYEFNTDGKIYHVDIYLQMELPPAEMLKSYEGVI
jgi:hypothetical protein